MALDELRVEETSGGTGDDLTIDARTGESLEIIARGIDSGGANELGPYVFIAAVFLALILGGAMSLASIVVTG